MDLRFPAPLMDRPDAFAAPEVMGRKEVKIALNQSNAFPGAALHSKAQSYGPLRNVSSASPPTAPLTSSLPPSPTSTTSSRFTNTTLRLSPKSMPRASSIESAISSISTTTTHSQKSSLDSFYSNPADISHLINTAGSPEAVIYHLLKEKQHSATQNAQLWRLVDKQRALLLGLNQDLENALKDKERYRKKLQEQMTHLGPNTGGGTITGRPGTSQSLSVHSNTKLPRQGISSQDPQSQSFVGPGPMGEKPSQLLLVSPRSVSADVSLPSTNQVLKERSPSVQERRSSKGSPIPQNYEGRANEEIPSLAPLNTALHSSHHNKPDPRSVVSSSSFTAKRLQPLSQKTPPGSPPTTAAGSPPINSPATFSPLRKLPPAPLDLRARDRTSPSPPLSGPDIHSASEYDDREGEALSPVERGRKKTREEDDREREAAVLKEQEGRSRSKKEKGSKTPSEPKTGDKVVPIPPPAAPIPSTIKAFSPEPDPGSQQYLSAPTSLAGVFTPTGPWPQTNVRGTVLSAQPLSPGLPMSPRPSDRPMNSPMPRMLRDGGATSMTSPPLSPPPGLVGAPLISRAIKQLSSIPPYTPVTPTPLANEHFKQPENESRHPRETTREPETRSSQENGPKPGALSIDLPRPSQAKMGFTGFESESYPGLLIPPNALPSITIKVTSSWFKPSRNSYLVSKGFEEEPVFALGVSARSDSRELWQVEKSLVSLPHLDQQIKQHSTFTAKLPDRSLFSSQAPAKIDARKVALEKYFENILDTVMNEKAALVLCHYLSTQVIDQNKEDSHGTVSTSGSPVTLNSEGRLIKEGYLTKRGKNFGGWKARFFVLDDPVMRYYESPGGSLLGTIKLHNAKIGKPTARQPSAVPSDGTDEHDSQYRHAFLILEPKRKDSSSHVRHVLCAESDAERDAWVQSLLYYVESYPESLDSKKPSLSSNDSSSSKTLLSQKLPFQKDSPHSETFEEMQALSYEDTVAAQPPSIHVLPDSQAHESPSPANTEKHAQTAISISGPSNGARIEDVGAWGNKPLAAPPIKDKEHKKRSIWGFREKHSLDFATIHPNDSSLSLTQQQYYEQIANVRPVFGMSLAEAVECCAPRVPNVFLPAVVYRCLEYLVARDAANEEGIFRLSGSTVVIKGLRDRFNLEGDFDFLADEQYHDVHAVASLLKLYLRELPTSVLTRELHLDFISVLCKTMPSGV